MASNIYRKLFSLRESIGKEQYSNFPELLAVVNKKAKYQKLLPLYSYLDGMATLTIVDLDEIESTVKFKVPADMVSIKNAKEHLYCMAFDIEGYNGVITPAQYNRLLEKMNELNVTEEQIQERYEVTSLPAMTQDIYERCMSALNKTKKQGA